eukprot:TRINITY_DN25995_c0_g1_i1.p1 TRINITY_DN25995_c0_g1~~TRINITY_DN25995_c0_g1_i1.p1  ORF type:complete len:476 (+),score=94.58 TRINITY_DN25995_c0_g1_i1:75-1430(+)
MGRLPCVPRDRERRLLLMGGMTASLFFLELGVGHWTNCVALIADSFHVFSDAAALGVAYVAIRLSRRPPSSRFTYGLIRAELVGALINAVALLALMASVATEAVHRLTEPAPVLMPEVLIPVALFGLLINMIGLLIFGEHAHAGSNCHAHSHAAGDGHSHQAFFRLETRDDDTPGSPLAEQRCPPEGNAEQDPPPQSAASPNCTGEAPAEAPLLSSAADAPASQCNPDVAAPAELSPRERVQLLSTPTAPALAKAGGAACTHSHSHAHGHGHAHGDSHGHGAGDGGCRSSETDVADADLFGQHGATNMRAVFLHVLGDALGSVAVVFGALVMTLAQGWGGRFIVDPLMSLLIVGIVIRATVPLVLELVRAMLLRVPEGVDTDAVRTRILELPDVRGVSRLRVWQLSETKAVATCRVTAASAASAPAVRRRTAQVLHASGIADVTVQMHYPE